MIKKLYIDKKFYKNLNKMKNKGGISSIVASRAEKMISDIQNPDDNFSALKFTKNGENRLKNCLKIELGNGFRIICFKKHSSLYMINLFSHEECDKWLNERLGKNFNEDDICYDNFMLYEINNTENNIIMNEIEIDEYENNLMSKLDENILTSIFHFSRKKLINFKS